VLLPLRVSSPGFYGLYKDEKTGAKWMTLEYLDQAVRFSKSEDPDAVIQAAQWIGRFHVEAETFLQKISRTSLIVHDEEYYLGWARRTLLFSGPLLRRFAWLPSLCERYSQMATLLPAKSKTVIHGEYYKENILFQGGIIRPVDWQSAAIAAGEIDLAFLTDKWSHDIVEEFELAYQRARWAERVPEDFQRVLRLAHLYQQFLWLGDRPERTVDDRCAWRFGRLKTEGERLGLI
jgi:aminoglycoside phosphotransferase (APT) family kinase protein